MRWDKNTIIRVPDFLSQQITVNGRVWSFDYYKRLGPLWLKKDGTDRKCQNPNKNVWAAFEKWLARKRMDAVRAIAREALEL